MAKAIPIIILVVLIGVVVFVVQSGVLGGLGNLKLSGIGPSSSSTASSSGSPFIVHPPQIQYGVPSSTYTAPSGGSSGGTQYKPALTPSSTYTYTPPAQVIPTSSIPEGFTRADLSPYFKRVTINSAYAGSGYVGSYGQILLYSSSGYFGSQATGTVDVTGWQLKASRGNIYIPQAVNIYDPSGLTAPSDIRLRVGDRLTIYSTQSAIGQNLHLNECIGYITNSAKFTPPIYTSCPLPSQEPGVSSFSGQCQNYLQTLSGCKVPGANPPVPQNDYACQDFLNTINYRGCFDRHRADANFLLNQWIVWTGSNFLDRYHDRLVLYDKSGLVVDTYKY